jgi:hypothetical protein
MNNELGGARFDAGLGVFRLRSTRPRIGFPICGAWPETLESARGRLTLQS